MSTTPTDRLLDGICSWATLTSRATVPDRCAASGGRGWPPTGSAGPERLLDFFGREYLKSGLKSSELSILGNDEVDSLDHAGRDDQGIG